MNIKITVNISQVEFYIDAILDISILGKSQEVTFFFKNT